MVYIFHTKKSRVNDIIYTDNVTFGKKLLRACVYCYTKTEFKLSFLILSYLSDMEHIAVCIYIIYRLNIIQPAGTPYHCPLVMFMS